MTKTGGEHGPTSPVGEPGDLFHLSMSRAADAPSPPRPSSTSAPVAGSRDDASDCATLSGNDEQQPSFPLPKLRLEVRDVMHAGARRFLSHVDASQLLPAAVADVQRELYGSPADPATHLPPTRSVTLILRDMGGVAYTTGSDLDSDHKEIHFSLGYIAGIAQNSTDAAAKDRIAKEIAGVVTHELVHCMQWDARGTCPGGLIEGIADFVRLRCGLAPPHWRRAVDRDWDAGYERTAYFLDYLECRFGPGTVRRINEALRHREYKEKPFWTGLLGRPVEQLWKDYVEASKSNSKEAQIE